MVRVFEEPLRGESKSRFSIDSPFGLSTENEGNTLMAKPSTCFLDSLSRIPFGNPTTNALNNDPLRVLGEEWDNAGSENINCNKNCTNEIDDIPSSHTLLNMIKIKSFCFLVSFLNISFIFPSDDGN